MSEFGRSYQYDTKGGRVERSDLDIIKKSETNESRNRFDNVGNNVPEEEDLDWLSELDKIIEGVDFEAIGSDEEIARAISEMRTNTSDGQDASSSSERLPSMQDVGADIDKSH